MLFPADLSFSAKPKGKTFLNFERIPPVEVPLIELLFGEIIVPVLVLVTYFLFSTEEESVGHLQLPVFSSIIALPQLIITSPQLYWPQKLAHSSALIRRFGSVSNADAPINSTKEILLVS